MYLNPSHCRRQQMLQRGIAVANRRLCPVPPQRTVTDRGCTHQRSVDVVNGHLTVAERGAIGQRRYIVRENVATVLFFKDIHLVGGKAVGTRGPGQRVQVGDAVPARQALGWSDQHR